MLPLCFAVLRRRCKAVAGLSNISSLFFGLATVAACTLLPGRASAQLVFGGQPFIAPSNVVELAWERSTDPLVSGYYVGWGTVSGQCTNRYNAGSTTNVFISGFQANFTYFFNVVAYDPIQESLPSTELSYTLPSNQPQAVGPKLSGQLVTTKNGKNIRLYMRLNFQAKAAKAYDVQASTNMTAWQAVLTTNTSIDTPVTCDVLTTTYSNRFFRLLQK